MIALLCVLLSLAGAVGFAEDGGEELLLPDVTLTGRDTRFLAPPPPVVLPAAVPAVEVDRAGYLPPGVPAPPVPGEQGAAVFFTPGGMPAAGGATSAAAAPGGGAAGGEPSRSLLELSLEYVPGQRAAARAQAAGGSGPWGSEGALWVEVPDGWLGVPAAPGSVQGRAAVRRSWLGAAATLQGYGGAFLPSGGPGRYLLGVEQTLRDAGGSLRQSTSSGGLAREGSREGVLAERLEVRLFGPPLRLLVGGSGVLYGLTEPQRLSPEALLFAGAALEPAASALRASLAGSLLLHRGAWRIYPRAAVRWLPAAGVVLQGFAAPYLDIPPDLELLGASAAELTLEPLAGFHGGVSAAGELPWVEASLAARIESGPRLTVEGGRLLREEGLRAAVSPRLMLRSPGDPPFFTAGWDMSVALSLPAALDSTLWGQIELHVQRAALGIIMAALWGDFPAEGLESLPGMPRLPFSGLALLLRLDREVLPGGTLSLEGQLLRPEDGGRFSFRALLGFQARFTRE